MVVTDRFLFLCNPRTGSRSLTRALLNWTEGNPYLGGSKHHASIEEVERIHNEDATKRIVAIVRNPVTQMLSWYYHSKSQQTFESFCAEYENGWLLNKRLNIYEDSDLPVEYYPYEEGLEQFLSEMFVHNVSVPHLGQSEVNHNLITEKATRIVEERFPDDLKLWLSVIVPW